MSKYADILEKASTQAERPASDAPAPPASATPAASIPAATPTRGFGQRAYAELATKLFPPTGVARVIAFAGVHHGAGVSRTVRGLCTELMRTGKKVAMLDGLLQGGLSFGAQRPNVGPRNEAAILGTPLDAKVETEAALLLGFRERYDCILLDCGALETSTDLLRLAQLSDGVVVVVEAGRTGKEQIERAARVITEANGTLLGCVFNKRQYPIPDWLYRLL